MPPKSKRATPKPQIEAFLRSINIELDADQPDRIGHFQPTEKSISLLDLLLSKTGDRAHLVVAPYGSGKSITSTVSLTGVVEAVAKPGSTSTSTS